MCKVRTSQSLIVQKNSSKQTYGLCLGWTSTFFLCNTFHSNTFPSPKRKVNIEEDSLKPNDQTLMRSPVRNGTHQIFQIFPHFTKSLSPCSCSKITMAVFSSTVGKFLLPRLSNQLFSVTYSLKQDTRTPCPKSNRASGKTEQSASATKVTFFHQYSKVQIIPIKNLKFKLVFSNFFGFSD